MSDEPKTAAQHNRQQGATVGDCTSDGGLPYVGLPHVATGETLRRWAETLGADGKPELRRFWLSWWQPGPDFRPREWPLGDVMDRFWCSSERTRRRQVFGAELVVEYVREYSLCAVVNAVDEAAAKGVVRLLWDIEGEPEWRWCDEKRAGWLPDADCFPLGTPSDGTPTTRPPTDGGSR